MSQFLLFIERIDPNDTGFIHWWSYLPWVILIYYLYNVGKKKDPYERKKEKDDFSPNDGSDSREVEREYFP